MKKTVIGVYRDLNDSPVNVKALLKAISTDLGSLVPENLNISLNDAAFAYDSAGTTSNMLATVSIGAGVNLADLPVVGRAFQQSQKLRFDVQVTCSESTWSVDDLKHVNALIQPPAQPFPQAAANATGKAITQCSLRLGDTTLSLDQVAFAPQHFPQGNPTSTPPRTNAPTIDWHPVQRALGPLLIQQVGIGFDAGVLKLYLDAQVAIAGLTVSLDALTISTPMQQLNPTIDLSGLGLQYNGSGVAVGASLMKIGKDVYAGTAMVETEAFSLSAIGAYAPNLNDHPSVMIYAFLGGLDAGPPCFTVTGLAASIGYNRGLVLPALDDVASFPLVAAAEQRDNVLSSAAASMQTPQDNGLANAISQLDQYFPPSEGANFVGFGVRFSSFGMVQGFMLMTASSAQSLNIDVLGLATATFPPQGRKRISPLAKIQMALIASWQPSSESFLVRSELAPDSYVISPMCRLSGGIDLALWYGNNPHAGDFVFTAGGYHPAFTPPPHYPVPARLGLKWQVCKELAVTGEAYFALCPHALMAGAKVRAVWISDTLEADFHMAFDLLIGWEPFSYRADLQESLSVRYHGRILGIQTSLSLELGAQLSLWGPDFSGTAHIDIEGIGFTLNFGNASQEGPTALSWEQFKASFLPASKPFWSHSVTAGATATSASPSDGDLGIVSAQDLRIVVQSAIPLASLAAGGEGMMSGTDIGIGPMGLDIGSVKAVASLKITDSNNDDMTSRFSTAAIKQSVPTGLWGGSLSPAANDPGLIEEALLGCTLAPGTEPTPGVSAKIPADTLLTDIEHQDNAFGWNKVSTPGLLDMGDDARRAQIAHAITRAATVQQDLIAALGVPVTVDCGATTAWAFAAPPQIVASAS